MEYKYSTHNQPSTCIFLISLNYNKFVQSRRNLYYSLTIKLHLMQLLSHCTCQCQISSGCQMLIHWILYVLEPSDNIIDLTLIMYMEHLHSLVYGILTTRIMANYMLLHAGCSHPHYITLKGKGKCGALQSASMSLTCFADFIISFPGIGTHTNTISSPLRECSTHLGSTLASN